MTEKEWAAHSECERLLKGAASEHGKLQVLEWARENGVAKSAADLDTLTVEVAKQEESVAQVVRRYLAAARELRAVADCGE